MSENVRAHVIVRGRVQGVFFRAETQRAAKKRGLLGWVRNRLDSTVEAIFEGNKEIVDDMLKWCHRGSPASKVDNVAVDWESYSGKFNSFEMRRTV